MVVTWQVLVQNDCVGEFAKPKYDFINLLDNDDGNRYNFQDSWSKPIQICITQWKRKLCMCLCLCGE